MQSYKGDELLKTLTGGVDELTKSISDDPEIKDATHHVIGILPKNGDIIKVNGLEFKIISVDNLKGRFVAKILNPKGK